MEALINKEPDVASKLYQLGFEAYMDEPEFVIQYLDFLTNQNDHKNLRVVYERVLGNLDPQHPKAKDIWDQFVLFQQRLLELPLLHQADRRRVEAMQSTDVGKHPHAVLQKIAAKKAAEQKERIRLHAQYPRPDISKLIHYRPGVRFLKRIAANEPPPLPPLPPAVDRLLRLLPPANLTQLF